MREEVTALLEQLGYTVTETDTALIDFFMKKVDSDMRSCTNLDTIPEELHEDYILAVCGEFLSIKKSSGEWDTSAVSTDAIKSITEGDTTVEYASAEESTSIDSLLKRMTDWQEKAVRFRKLVW